MRDEKELTGRIVRYLEFIKEAGLLKGVLRTAWGEDGRQESTAEHSFRLALFAGLVLDEFPELDRERVLLMCLLHDMGELYDGDISAALLPDEQKKHEQEYRSVKKVFSLLPGQQEEKFLKIWEEYDSNSTPEAHLVKALDKAETIIQHNQGKNPEGFDYGFNLEYGIQYFKENEILSEIRGLLDKETAERQK